MNMESQKGKDCPFKPITCQEGWCEGCQIHLDYQTKQQWLNQWGKGQTSPLNDLREKILKLRDEAYAESAYSRSREGQLCAQARQGAYEIILGMMK